MTTEQEKILAEIKQRIAACKSYDEMMNIIVEYIFVNFTRRNNPLAEIKAATKPKLNRTAR